MVKGMLHNLNQYTDLLMIHWGIRTQSGWNAMNHYLAEMTPVTLLFGSTFNKFNTTDSSIKEIWTNDTTGSYTFTIIMCGEWSYISACNKDSVLPQKTLWPWVLAHCSCVTCALPHRVIMSCKVMPSHKMQIYWNKSINKSGIWLLRHLVDVQKIF